MENLVIGGVLGLGSVLLCLRGDFPRSLVDASGAGPHKKSPPRGGRGDSAEQLRAGAVGRWCGCGCLEAHHLGHGARVGLQAGVEASLVVLYGSGGILQAVAREHAHHRGAGGHLLVALEQAGH